MPGCSGYIGLAITQKSPTSFFSYQDLQIDQVTACSHFWGAVLPSPLCVILFAIPLSAFWSLVGVVGVESVLPPFKSFSGWQSSSKTHQVFPVRELGGEKEVIFLPHTKQMSAAQGQSEEKIWFYHSWEETTLPRGKKNPGVCFPLQWTVLVLVLRKAVSKVQWCSCGQSGDVEHVQGRKHLKPFAWEFLCKFLVKSMAGSLWSSPAALEQTFVGRRRQHLSDWLMHLYKYCCLLKSETAQGFLTEGEGRKEQCPLGVRWSGLIPDWAKVQGKILLTWCYSLIDLINLILSYNAFHGSYRKIFSFYPSYLRRQERHFMFLFFFIFQSFCFPNRTADGNLECTIPTEYICLKNE